MLSEWLTRLLRLPPSVIVCVTNRCLLFAPPHAMQLEDGQGLSYEEHYRMRGQHKGHVLRVYSAAGSP